MNYCNCGVGVGTDGRAEPVTKRIKVEQYDISKAIPDDIHTNILVKSSCGPAIPADRALLASKSEIFRTMLTCDECKASKYEIFLPDLTHEVLSSLIDFLYTGDLPTASDCESIHDLCSSLLLASNKYKIPFLQSSCEHQLMQLLTSDNVLWVLEISERCSSQLLKEGAMKYIFTHGDEVLSSVDCTKFMTSNPNLVIEIIRDMHRRSINKAPNTA